MNTELIAIFVKNKRTKNIIKSTVANFSKQINLDAPSGIYFVKVSDGDKVWTGKVVVR